MREVKKTKQTKKTHSLDFCLLSYSGSKLACINTIFFSSICSNWSWIPLFLRQKSMSYFTIFQTITRRQTRFCCSHSQLIWTMSHQTQGLLMCYVDSVNRNLALLRPCRPPSPAFLWNCTMRDWTSSKPSVLLCSLKGFLLERIV